MNIDPKSWHYRLIKFITFREQRSGQVPTSLCPYVRAVLYRILFFGFIVLAAGALLTGLLYTPVAMWLGATFGITNIFLVGLASFVSTTVLLGSILAACIGIAVVIATVVHKIAEKLYDRKWEKINKKAEEAAKGIKPPEPGLIVSFLKSRHDQICPTLTFNKKD